MSHSPDWDNGFDAGATEVLLTLRETVKDYQRRGYIVAFPAGMLREVERTVLGDVTVFKSDVPRQDNEVDHIRRSGL